jgi:hypothetical protein
MCASAAALANAFHDASFGRRVQGRLIAVKRARALLTKPVGQLALRAFELGEVSGSSHVACEPKRRIEFSLQLIVLCFASFPAPSPHSVA